MREAECEAETKRREQAKKERPQEQKCWRGVDAVWLESERRASARGKQLCFIWVEQRGVVKHRAAAGIDKSGKHRECNKGSQASEPKFRPLLLGS